MGVAAAWRRSLEEDLRRNVAEDIVILFNRGTFRGHDEVRHPDDAGRGVPEHEAFQYTYSAVEGRMAFLEWAYEDSPRGSRTVSTPI